MNASLKFFSNKHLYRGHFENSTFLLPGIKEQLLTSVEPRGDSLVFEKLETKVEKIQRSLFVSKRKLLCRDYTKVVIVIGF